MAAFITTQTRSAFQLDDAAFPNDAFSSTRDLSLRRGAMNKAASLRAFGWFEREPMIAQRVVNESADIVDDLEERFPAE